MESDLLGALVDFGALGLASGAIFWMYLRMSKRMDVQTDSFQSQLREQAQEFNDRESQIRDRYDDVVRKYDEERLQWTGRLETLSKGMASVEGNVKLILELLSDRAG